MQDWIKNIQDFDAWLAKPTGQQFLQLQQPMLDGICHNLAGELLLLFNAHRLTQLQHQFNSVVKIACDAEVACDVVTAPFALPFTADQADALILPLILEFMPDVKQVFQEAERVLKPEGTLVITGINKTSWLTNKMTDSNVFQALQYVNVNDLQRELFLQGFDLVERKKFSFMPLGIENKALNKLGRFVTPFMANGFMLVMKKRVENVTPLFDKWHKGIVIKQPSLANMVAGQNNCAKS